MKITFLGTGANGGTPQVDCKCENCLAASQDSKLSRLRSCLLVETSKGKIILDCGPDFRQQLLKADVKFSGISLIVITHLHFDHAEGLMELSAGKASNIPVLASPENQAILEQRPDILYLIKEGFVRLIDKNEGESFGVRLVNVPHSKTFPTSAVIVKDGLKRLWYTPDVAEITPDMARQIEEMSLVVFDSTFLNEKVYPASKYGHMTIERSVPKLARVNKNVIYSHVNHSENPDAVKNFLAKFGYKLADDMLTHAL